MNLKMFSIHSVRNLLAVVFVLGLAYVAYTVNPNTVNPTKVEAGVSDNVSGWAYSMGGGTALDDGNTGVGWISLNSKDCDLDANGFIDSGVCGGNNTSKVVHNYGVNISPLTGTGIFSGYAWSENVGWITFNSGELAGCPLGTCNAQVDWTTGKVTGWARVLSQASGGDGWIKLGGDGLSWNGTACTGVSDYANTNQCNYGVRINTATGNFSGKAWSSDSLGWIDFTPLINGTTPLTAPAKVAVPCTASNPTFSPTGICDATASCVSGGSDTQTNLTGVQSGTCTDGSTGTAYTTCTDPITTCTAGVGTAGISSWFKGDSVCSTALGENSTNSLADCKPKTKFWQF